MQEWAKRLWGVREKGYGREIRDEKSVRMETKEREIVRDTGRRKRDIGKAVGNIRVEAKRNETGMCRV